MKSFVIKIIDFLWLMWWLHKCFLDCKIVVERFFFLDLYWIKINFVDFSKYSIFSFVFCFLFQFLNSIIYFTLLFTHFLNYSIIFISVFFFLYWFIDSLLQNFLKIIPLKQKNYILVSFLNFCLDVMFFKKHQTKLIFRRANNRINHFDQPTHPSLAYFYFLYLYAFFFILYSSYS